MQRLLLAALCWLCATSCAPTTLRSHYVGTGSGSISERVIARYGAKPLPPALSRKIQQSFDIRTPANARLSADGKHLYLSWNVTGTEQVWRLDGPNTFPVQLTGGEDPTQLMDLTPDGETLILSRDLDADENPGIFTMPARGGPMTAIQHISKVKTTFEYVSADSRWVYFRANDLDPNSFAIHRYDLKNRVRETIFSAPGQWSLADFREDGRLLLLLNKGVGRDEYWQWDPAKRELKAMLGVEEPGDYLAQYGARAGQLLVVTPEFSDVRRLYAFENGIWTPISPAMPWSVARTNQTRSRDKFFYTVNEGGFTKLHAFDPRTLAAIALPALPAAINYGIPISPLHGRKSVFTIGLATSPAQTWVYDWVSAELVRWFVPSTPEIDTSRFAVPTVAHYPARDGTLIPAVVRRPERCAPAPCPVLVMFHGGPESQSTPRFSAVDQLWVDAGYVLVEPNVRGSEGYGKAWLDADNGAKRLEVWTDIADAAPWARKTFAVDGVAPKVGVLGRSYGGYSTMLAMTKFAGSYDAGVSTVGMSNLVSFLENTAPYRRAARESEYGSLVHDRETLMALSPITYSHQLKGPLLIIQGAEDPRVPVGEALQMYAAARKRRVPAGLIIFAGEGHQSRQRNNLVLELGHTMLWFDRYLKGAVHAP